MSADFGGSSCHTAHNVRSHRRRSRRKRVVNIGEDTAVFPLEYIHRSMPSTDPRSIATGSLIGTLSWLIGYAITYLLVAPNLRDSPLNRIIETLDGAPATHELVGWVFYNAHFVDVVLDIPILGSQTTAYIGGDTGFTPALYLVPVVLLLAGGALISRQQAATDPTAGGFAGLTVGLGYLPLTVIGGLLFEITVGGATGGPDLTAAIILAGVIYPAVCAGIGGVGWAVFENTR